MSADIVYSVATGRVRRIITFGGPSADLLHNGEARLTVTDTQYESFSDLYAIQAFVSTLTGLIPSGDRYVSVDGSNNVLSAHLADPACGDVSPQTGVPLVAHMTATRGDLLWGTTLLPNVPALHSRSNAVLNRFGQRNQQLP